MKDCLIWISGYPGVGKFTIAKELKALIGQDAILIDNHQLIDVVDLPRDHVDYQSQRKAVRAQAFERVLFNGETATKVAIFTDFLTTSESGKSIALEYKTAAKSSGRAFLPVHLECDATENLSRVASEGRQTSGTSKIVELDLVRTLRDSFESFRWPEGFCLDLTSLSPQEAALRILRDVEAKSQYELAVSCEDKVGQ